MNFNHAYEMEAVVNQMASMAEAAVKQAVREGMVLALADIEAAVMRRLRSPRVVRHEGADGSVTLTVTFEERKDG